ncbi:MAG: hypothetical protein O2791_03250, partial [Bacteroidetes bacterium]|nr:hypothetical protein [Bacteroidota bacterium]
QAREEAAHKFEHIVHGVRVLRFGLTQNCTALERVKGTQFNSINACLLKSLKNRVNTHFQRIKNGDLEPPFRRNSSMNPLEISIVPSVLNAQKELDPLTEPSKTPLTPLPGILGNHQRSNMLTSRDSKHHDPRKCPSESHQVSGHQYRVHDTLYVG